MEETYQNVNKYNKQSVELPYNILVDNYTIYRTHEIGSIKCYSEKCVQFVQKRLRFVTVIVKSREIKRCSREFNCHIDLTIVVGKVFSEELREHCCVIILEEPRT